MKKTLLMLALVAMCGTAALAQGVTTASISGLIKGQDGESLPGATVVAVHQPSGTQYGTTTLEDGRFFIPNARIGGPYKVSVSFVGFATQVKEGVMLSLGVTSNLNFALQQEGTNLEAVTVTGSSVINSDRTGALTNVSNKQITSLPTLTRSFNDYVRLTPQANGNSFGGRSSSFNNITVDGGLFNNAFGLEGTVGGQANAQPISLDAVDQITTSIAPYDVREGSFTGAGVNVVTRSGTNSVNGSVYYFTRSDGTANKMVRNLESPLGDFSQKNMGFRLGGPVVKDKVFFFLNYETDQRAEPGTLFRATRPDVSGTNVSEAQASQLDDLRTFLIANYGFDAGAYEGYDLETNSSKAAAKIDINLSRIHKITLKYNFLDSYRDAVPSASGAIGNTRSPGVTGLPFLGAYYRINNDLSSFTAELNSNFSNKFSNKFQVGYTQMRDSREIVTSDKAFPLVDIGNGNGGFLTAFGTEPFSANNLLNTDIIQISDNLDMFKGKHTLSFGTYNEIYTFQNGFAPAYNGLYQFASLQDFYASAAGTPGRVQRYELRWAANPTGTFPLVETNAVQLGFYAQDKYEFSSKLNVTLGLRADIPMISADIQRNEQAAGFTFRNGEQILTNQLQETSVLWSPRVGFNWDVRGDQTTQVRGGTGVFTGRVPYVWISNQASNNGVLFGSRVFAGADLAAVTFTDNINAYRPLGDQAVASANYNLAVTDKNFKFPQVWRTNLAVDQNLGNGLVASVDLAFTKDINAVYHQNVNLPEEGSLQRAAGADNRPIFFTIFPNNGNNGTAPAPNTPARVNRIHANISDAIVMRNTNQGYSYFATAQVRKSFDFGLDASLAYTYTDSRSVNDGGSIAQSIWRDRQVSGDPNENVLGFFRSLQRHRIIGSMNYRKEYLGFLATTVGLVYELAPQGRFSYIYSGDMNGDNSGGAGNDLIYIPRDQSEIVLRDIPHGDGTFYTAAQQWADLDAYIEQDDYLSERRGQYAERNGAEFPWVGQLDFRLLQDFFVDVKGKRNTIQVSVDIQNFGNMINSEWGVYRQTNRNALLNFVGYDANRNPIFTYPYLNANNREPLRSTFRDNLGLASRWQLQVGVRYIFGN